MHKPSSNHTIDFVMAPWESGICVWILGVLALLVVPAGYPPQLFDGFLPDYLLLAPSRLGWLYLLLCPVAAVPPALLTAGLHAFMNRLFRGRLPELVTMFTIVLGMAASLVWVATVYRGSAAPMPQVPPAHDVPSQAV